MMKILLVEDEMIVREGLRAILKSSPGLSIVGEAQDGEEAIRLAKELTPDLVLMDTKLPGVNGLEAARRIKLELPAVKIFFLSAWVSDLLLQEAIQCGAVGYVLKDSSTAELLQGLHEASRGNGFFIGDGIAQPQKLTERETEVLRRIADGFPIKRIAAKLNVSDKTVARAKKSLMHKLSIYHRGVGAILAY